MLLRGANAVGYTSYPDNVIEHFVHLAASNGMDVFRIFDCFNDVANMQVAIDAVRKAGKVSMLASPPSPAPTTFAVLLFALLPGRPLPPFSPPFYLADLRPSLYPFSLTVDPVSFPHR